MVQWVRIHCQRRARGFGPRSGRMPHASEGPSPRVTSAAAALPWSPGAVSAEVCAPELRGRGSPGNEEQPLLTATRGVHAEPQGPSTAPNGQIKNARDGKLCAWSGWGHERFCATYSIFYRSKVTLKPTVYSLFLKNSQPRGNVGGIRKPPERAPGATAGTVRVRK